MQAGKLPLEYLEKILGGLSSNDPRVALGPAAGEDAALIDMGDKYLVAKTDPITFATDRIGWYAVQVNANDIAVMGAVPKWMMATILLPEGSSEKQIESVIAQLNEACNDIGVSLIGGHTEITYDLPRPIISGVMLGEVDKGKEVRSSGAREGDSIIMTKAIAIEGCSILAFEAGNRLIEAGLSQEDVDAGKRLLNNPGISVVRDARISVAAGKITAMHDPTEGGITGGLRELAMASGLGMKIDQNCIALTNTTRQYCDALSLDPLGLIASGSLLACVSPEDEKAVIEALWSEGRAAWKIGEMLEKSFGVKISSGVRTQDLPKFERDEIARFFSA